MKAARRGDLDEVKKLLALEVFRSHVDQQDEDGNTALLFAAKKGSEDILDQLLKNGADSSLNNFKERTLLMNAVLGGNPNIVTKLLEIQTVKDNINDTDKEGDTALFLANREGYKEIADLLLENGAIRQPVKEAFLNMKRAFKKILFLKNPEEKDQLRQTAAKSKEEESHSQSFLGRIITFFKNLFQFIRYCKNSAFLYSPLLRSRAIQVAPSLQILLEFSYKI